MYRNVLVKGGSQIGSRTHKGAFCGQIASTQIVLAFSQGYKHSDLSRRGRYNRRKYRDTAVKTRGFALSQASTAEIQTLVSMRMNRRLHSHG